MYRKFSVIQTGSRSRNIPKDFQGRHLLNSQDSLRNFTVELGDSRHQMNLKAPY